ncbi:MAG: hypothetical protein WC222_05665 [Parachlamydiales bacterium]|jgi:hypothetical protein
MKQSIFLDRNGGIIALVTLLVSWFLFTSDTSMLFKSFTAALLTSGLVWISYVMLRWLIDSFRGE